MAPIFKWNDNLGRKLVAGIAFRRPSPCEMPASGGISRTQTITHDPLPAPVLSILE
jgi:hypothetical protein